MKRGKRWAISFLVWFLSSAVFFRMIPTESTPDGEVITSLPAACVFVFLPIVIAVFTNSFFKRKTKKAIEKEQKKKEDEKRFFECLENIPYFLEKANNANSISEFITHYDFAIKLSEEAEAIRNKMEQPLNIPKNKKSETLKHEFHWHLRDAIESVCYKIISKSKNEFRNNRSGTLEEYESFKDTISFVLNTRFDEETKELSEKYLTILEDDIFFRNTQSANGQSTLPYITTEFDNMEGHEFEHWCANLLMRNNYENVSVTRGSGDHGVDILASKDGINYAIQCKCYSSDLGNTPVQEVNAGKVMYGCQIGAVMTNRYFTKGAKELATKTGVLLWDRDVILKLLKDAPVKD